MASPFRVFRKYQKTLLAVAGVVLMFVFVVGDSLFSYFGGGRNARGGDDHDAKATAVHWDGGKLTNRQLNELVFRRRVLNNFLKNVEMEGTRPSVEVGVDPPELRVQRLMAPEQQIESSVVKTKLLADAASESGMKISDDTLVQYLSELGRKNVSPEKMRAMLNNVSSGGARVSIDYVIEALREEMLAHNYRISHEFAFETVTPQQRWKDWSRVNDRVVVEAAAVPADIYLADVKEPTEAELIAFFDKYKDHEAAPDFFGNTEMPSATPGFRIPRKVDLQFIEGNYNEFLAKAEPKITDEEIAKYYEEHKDLFPKMNVGLKEDQAPNKDAPKSDAPATKPDAKDGAKEAKPADAEKKAAEPAEKKTESPAKEAPPASKDGKTESKSSDAKKSSYQPNRAKSVFRLTVFAEDAAKKDAKDAKPTEKANDTPAAKTETAENKSAPPAEKPAASTPPAPPVGTSEASKGASAALAPPAAAAPAPKKPVEYQPLSEVKDEIRRRLAEQKVEEELSKLTDGAQAQLQGVFEKWRYSDSQFSDAEKAKKEQPAPPKSLTDFAAIAQKNGLKNGQTGPKSVLELRNMPLGETVTDSDIPLLRLLFSGHDLDLYQPVKTVGKVSKDRFVVAKTSDTPGRVPTLAEVKDEVVKAWKNQQAAELAQKHAEEFAKKAQEAKSPLASFFADNKSIKVVRTDPFSELTGGEVGMVGGQLQQQPYKFSQPSEITAAGPDFMRGVFNLKDGQVGVLLNNDHSIAYVVRIVEHQPSLAELRNNYLADAYSWYGENIMNQMHRQEVASNLDNDIEVRTNLKWDRAADQAKNEQRDEG